MNICKRFKFFIDTPQLVSTQFDRRKLVTLSVRLRLHQLTVTVTVTVADRDDTVSLTTVVRILM